MPRFPLPQSRKQGKQRPEWDTAQRNITLGKAVTARGAQWDLILPHPRATFLPKRAVLSVPGLRAAGSWEGADTRQSHRSSDEGEEPVNS